MKEDNNQDNNIVVEDGHIASFRNKDGSIKNIYANDGSLTGEGKDVMAAREALSKLNKNTFANEGSSADENKDSLADENKNVVVAAQETISQSNENSEKREEEIKLYSLKTITLATFLGGLLVAAILIRENFQISE